MKIKYKVHYLKSHERKGLQRMTLIKKYGCERRNFSENYKIEREREYVENMINQLRLISI